MAARAERKRIFNVDDAVSTHITRERKNAVPADMAQRQQCVRMHGTRSLNFLRVFSNNSMKINVGSKNDVKVQAVRESIRDYKFLSSAAVSGIDVRSEISEQPKTLEETIRGARNRARNAFQNCDYSFGLEDGLMQVPTAETGYMNICACVIYDSRNYHLGLSSAFEYPPEVTRLVFEEELDINQAFHRICLTKNPKVGSTEGAIGILTHGRLPRKEYTKQAIVTALIHLENSGGYGARHLQFSLLLL